MNSQQAYQMLVDYVPTSNMTSQHDNHGGGISYLQHDDEKTTNNVSHSTVCTGQSGGRSSNRGGRGGRSGGRHAGEASHLTKAVPNDS